MIKDFWDKKKENSLCFDEQYVPFSRELFFKSFHNYGSVIFTIKENIERECGTKETLKINKMWKKYYEKQNYKFMSRENIYKSIVKILNNKFSK